MGKENIEAAKQQIEKTRETTKQLFRENRDKTRIAEIYLTQLHREEDLIHEFAETISTLELYILGEEESNDNSKSR